MFGNTNTPEACHKSGSKNPYRGTNGHAATYTAQAAANWERREVVGQAAIAAGVAASRAMHTTEEEDYVRWTPKRRAEKKRAAVLAKTRQRWPLDLFEDFKALELRHDRYGAATREYEDLHILLPALRTFLRGGGAGIRAASELPTHIRVAASGAVYATLEHHPPGFKRGVVQTIHATLTTTAAAASPTWRSRAPTATHPGTPLSGCCSPCRGTGGSPWTARSCASMRPSTMCSRRSRA
jgi:hypothetical protein